MNICFLADAKAEHTRRWTRYFALKGHRVDLITWNSEVLGDYEPVQVHVLHKPWGGADLLSRSRNLLFILAETRKIIRQIQPDILHAHTAGAYAWLGMTTGFHPYVITPWGSDVLIDIEDSRLTRFMTVRALRSADLITCDAQHVKDKMIGLGVEAKRIQIVMFGVGPEYFVKQEVDKVALRRSFGLRDALIVVSSRTLTPVHDVATFVRAVPLAKDKHPTVRFVIVGDGPERRMIEGLAGELGVRDAIRFAGYVSEQEMMRWLQVADVYVSTSLSDAGLAASTAEAMACGLPVVITDNADNKCWVTDGEGGFLVPNGAFDALARRIVQLLSDGQMRLDFGRTNRLIIEQRNNRVREMDRLEMLYRELADRKSVV